MTNPSPVETQVAYVVLQNNPSRTQNANQGMRRVKKQRPRQNHSAEASDKMRFFVCNLPKESSRFNARLRTTSASGANETERSHALGMLWFYSAIVCDIIDAYLQ